MSKAIALRPLFEVIDSMAQPESGCDCGFCNDVMASRPLETEADLIAAAAPRGDIYTRRMAELQDDVPYGSTEEEPAWSSPANSALHDLSIWWPQDITVAWGVAP